MLKPFQPQSIDLTMTARVSKMYFVGDASAITEINNQYSYIDISDTLVSFEDTTITQVYQIEGMVGYADEEMDHIWISGFKSNSSSINFNKSLSNLSIIPKEFTYFKDHHIKIKQICSNMASEYLFITTDKNELYAVGSNGYNGKKHKNDVKLLSLQNVIDIQSSGSVTFALCTQDINIQKLPIWSQLKQLPRDIVNTILSFSVLTETFIILYQMRLHHEQLCIE